MRKVIAVSVLLLLSRISFGQNNVQLSEKLLTRAEFHAKTLYSESNKQRIYHGTRYTPIFVNKDTDTGHPFYLRDSMQYELIEYEGIEYKNVPLLFDLLQNKLVSLIPNTAIRISLIQESISKFTIDGHTFVKIEKSLTSSPDLSSGFYDLLYKGDEISVYANRKKKASESNNDLLIKKNYIDKTDIVIFKNNTYYLVKKKRTVMNLINDKRDKIEIALKNEKGRSARKNLESFVVYVSSEYDKP